MLSAFFEMRYWDVMANYIGDARELVDEYLKEFITHIPMVTLDDNDVVIEIGSGAFSVLTHIHGVKKICIEPLAEHLRDIGFNLDRSIEWVPCNFDEYRVNKKARAIFMLNVIDHVDRLDLFLKALDGCLLDNGFFVLTVNCHNYRAIKKIFSLFKVLIDPFHPQDFSVDDIRHLFHGYSLLECCKIDSGDIMKAANIRMGHKAALALPLIYTLPFRLPFMILRCFGINWYDENDGRASLFSKYLFVFKKA